MAAECRLAERRVVEIKMGRSRFPGKPSKIGNRKRVNLSSCALPEENESSKAAENIYLGLSMFNETFGDNEMVQLEPFYGFCAEDIKDAMAQARLQQRESEMELTRQGIKISLQNSFQSELFSIIGSFTLNGNNDKNKTRLCFDGGGSHIVKDYTKVEKISDSKLINTDKKMNCLNENNDNVVMNGFESELNFANREENKSKTIKPGNLQKNSFKYHKAKNSFKSLQSRAAKRLLEKAKMSNLNEIKCNTSERKFVLPSYSMHSLRVIKPNKRFLEDNDQKKERLQRAQFKTQKLLSAINESKSLGKDLHLKELKVELTDVNIEKKMKKEELSLEEKTSNKLILNDKLGINCSSDLSKTSANYTSSGKLILREPKLQLVRINLGIKEGPFSSSSRSSSLSPNGNLQGNHIQTSIMHRATTCGVCGSAKFYKYFELSKKFGTYCCEPCKKFISGIIKSVETETNKKLLCLKGKGLCSVPPLIKSQHSSVIGMDCQACWLKLCLKYFKMSHRLKSKLLQLLPSDMHLSVNLDSTVTSKDDINTFGISSNNVRNFGWIKKIDQKSAINKINRITGLDLEKKEKKSLTSLTGKRESNLRKLNIIKRLENKRRLLRHKGRIKVLTESGNRQRIDLKGPRVKNVCRSASVVLGQPIATFPLELSPKKQINDFPLETIKNCDKLEATNRYSIESQGITVINKNSKDAPMTETKQSGFEKKSSHGNKQIVQIKRSCSPPQRFGMEGSRRKQSSKTENPISIDFWETYDPEEICETGFGLIGSENFSVRALCFLCGSSGQEKLIHCASCCEPYHEFCLDEEQVKRQDEVWKYDWVCPRCTICVTCGKASGHQLKCVKCDNSYHMECVDRVGGRLLHSPDRPWVCSMCLRCKSCNGVDVSVFVGNLPLCRSCFALQQKGNYCPLCQRCYEDNDYDSKMMECGQCKCWVHAKCEGLSDEKYQVLSFLPESVEYICRMCCVMPPAPWWIAIEAELKSGYLGVLKALSKNRKACTMLKWSPKKQCTCRQANFTPRALDFEGIKSIKSSSDQCQNKAEELKTNEQEVEIEKFRRGNVKSAPVSEKKNCFEAINGVANGSLKLTLKIMKGTTICSETSEKNELESEEKSKKMKDIMEMHNIKKCSVRIKKCTSLPENSRLPMNSSENIENIQLITKNFDIPSSHSEFNEKKSLFLPLNSSNYSRTGSTDDELKAISPMDEANCKLYDQHSNRIFDAKNTSEPVSFLESKNDCICFLEVDSYNSRSKPFSPNLLSIKKKVITSEYSSLQQFHVDMQSMIATTQSTELMEMYYQTLKEIFPWFDPRFSRVYNNSQKISGNMSTESTPIKNSPVKIASVEDCKVPKELLVGRPLEYYYNGYVEKDNRICLMCKEIGDGAPNKTGRLLYCGQNEWVHCNCALWSAEVFEEIDGSLQNVHSAISRGRSIRCSECNLKGASIGCCFKNCSETYHFTCARNVGCSFMDDKTVFCPTHANEGKNKGIQKEKEFEIRRPVYVELDKKKMKSVDSSQVRFAVGSLQVENLGKFVMKVSDYPEAIIPDQFRCTRLFWSCYEPWKIVKYHFTARLQEDEEKEGIDFGINLTVDHSLASEILNVKLQQLKYFQEHNKLLEIDEPSFEDMVKEKRKLTDTKSEDDGKIKSDDLRCIPAKRLKVDNKIMKKIVDVFDPREDESCLSDSQNTADLLPPELEEAIFKDLPNDILDGISMQDIFMDIKTDLYENGEKEAKDVDEPLETEEVTNEQTKLKKTDSNGENNQSENWTASEDSKQNVYEWIDETCSKSNRDTRRNRSDVILPRRNVALRSNQRSCSFNWNCKMDIHTAKWKRNSKCTTVNPLEPQERGNMLQELKFTDGLVMVSTEGLDRVMDLKDRLTIQHEEGKENKCLSWHMKLQPRLLQVDGGVDSSSSGSEAGESPQRVIEENVVNAATPQPSSFSSNISYVGLNTQYPSSHTDYPYISPTFNLPQIDGADDSGSDNSDFEHSPQYKSLSVNYKINSLAESSDSRNETKTDHQDKLRTPMANSFVKDEPVKCKQCHCTYRTKISYERHLENCSNDYILFTSDDEGSEEDSSFHHLKAEEDIVESHRSTKIDPGIPSLTNDSNQNSLKCNSQKTEVESNNCNEQILMNNEVKKKRKKKSQMQRKPVLSTKKAPIISNSQNVQPILMQTNTVPPALIVQDIPQSNIVPNAFIDTSSTFQYVTSQGAFTKPQLIANTNTTIPGNFHIQTHGSQLVSSLPVLSQNIHPNMAGIVIQHPQVPGTLISPQPTSVVMAGDQMILGTTPLFDVIHDPQTGGMYLANQNQPIFYNTETIVSNTVMQTNQYVSNVMTASSFSQTSTHVVQTSKLEQIMNIPSNYILIGHNTTTNKMLSSGDLICLPPVQPVIQNQTPVQTIINPIIQPPQTYNAEPKIIPVLVNPSIRPAQSLPSQRLCTPVVSGKAEIVKNINSSSEIRQCVPALANKNLTQNKQCNNNFKSMPMMRPNIAKSPPKQFEKAVIVPKTQKNGSRALVDFINNFKTDNCDFYSSLNHSEASMKREKMQLLGEKLSNANGKITYSEKNFVSDNSALSRSRSPVMSSLTLSPSFRPVQNEKERETIRNKQEIPVLKKIPKFIESQSVQIMEVDIKEDAGFNDKRTNSITQESVSENVNDETLKIDNKSETERKAFYKVGKNMTEKKEFHNGEKNMTEREKFDDGDENMGGKEGFIDDKNTTKKEEFDDDDANLTEKEEFDDDDDDDDDGGGGGGGGGDGGVGDRDDDDDDGDDDDDDDDDDGDDDDEDDDNDDDVDDDDDNDDDDDDKIMAERKIDSNDKNMTEECGNSEVKDDEQTTNEKREHSSKEENSIANVLPLQETSPSVNNTHNVLPRISNLKMEGFKEKNKLFSSNQNCITTKLVTIHPRLIQFPTSEHETESENKKFSNNGKLEEKGPKLIFDVTSDDGFKSSSTSMSELWAKICDSVQEMRAVFKIPPLPISRKGHEILGMQNHGLQHCLEQLRGVEHCVKYKCKYFVKERTQKTAEDGLLLKENLSGCARTESFCDRKDYDMFAWLASRHRRLPKLNETTEEIFSTARRANSLPMAMRYRHLKETAKTYVGVYRSKIHGKGLFCLREIEAGEMVIEYAGEVIRSNITDKREKYYTDKGIGCYMFRIDDHFVVDATMKGNAARFINHSCEPNCYSRVVDILGKKHIVIFALRRIHVMEELTYDYKFPFEDEKISCHCLSKKCRKYLN